MTLTRISDQQRRDRIVARHFGGGTPTQIVEANVVLHSTDPATVYLSLRGRNPTLTREDIDDALYGERSVIRHLAMRRTLFVAPTDLVDDLHRSCTVDVHERERRRLVKMIAESDLNAGADPDAWLGSLEARTLEAVEAVEAAGGVAAEDLRGAVPELAQKLVVERLRVATGLSTFVLSRLAMAGRVMRGRPRGTWVSGTYHWHETTRWLGRPLPTDDREGARSRLAARWLRRFGPATVDDLQWWTGWTKTATRKALESVDAIPVTLDDGQGAWVAPDDEHVEENGDDRIRFLPGLDGTAMGWKLDRRAFYVDPAHSDLLYDRSGNIGPTIWRGGRVVGAWGQTPDGVVRWQLLDPEDVDQDEVTAEAAELATWLDGRAVKPRFPTPLQRQLAAT